MDGSSGDAMSQITLPRKVRGIRDTIPAGYVLGRTSAGNGKTELIPMAKLGSRLVATGAVATPTQVAAAGSGLFAPILSAKPTKVSTGFTTVLNGGAGVTLTDTAMGISIFAPSSFGGNAIVGLVKPAPTPPYTATMLILPSATDLEGNWFFVAGWRNTTSLKLDTLGAGGGTNWDRLEWTNPAALAASPNVGNWRGSPHVWVQFKDDGTTATMSISYDGINFFALSTVTEAGSFLGTGGYNQLFIGLDASGASCALTLASYVD
jgi:hypothetical protein